MLSLFLAPPHRLLPFRTFFPSGRHVIPVEPQLSGKVARNNLLLVQCGMRIDMYLADDSHGPLTTALALMRAPSLSPVFTHILLPPRSVDDDVTCDAHDLERLVAVITPSSAASLMY